MILTARLITSSQRIHLGNCCGSAGGCSGSGFRLFPFPGVVSFNPKKHGATPPLTILPFVFADTSGHRPVLQVSGDCFLYALIKTCVRISANPASRNPSPLAPLVLVVLVNFHTITPSTTRTNTTNNTLCDFNRSFTETLDDTISLICPGIYLLFAGIICYRSQSIITKTQNQNKTTTNTKPKPKTKQTQNQNIAHHFSRCESNYALVGPVTTGLMKSTPTTLSLIARWSGSKLIKSLIDWLSFSILAALSSIERNTS